MPWAVNTHSKSGCRKKREVKADKRMEWAGRWRRYRSTHLDRSTLGSYCACDSLIPALGLLASLSSFCIGSSQIFICNLALHSSKDSSSVGTLLILQSKCVTSLRMEQESGTPKVKGNRNSKCPLLSRKLLVNTCWRLPHHGVRLALKAFQFLKRSQKYGSQNLQFKKKIPFFGGQKLKRVQG